MLLQSSASSSVEAPMSFASNHADQGLLCEWVPPKVWHSCSECAELPKDGSELLTSGNICVNSGQNLMCKRRKLQKSSVSVYSVEPAAAAIKKDPYESGFGGSDVIDHSQRVHDNPCVEAKHSLNPDVDSKSQIVSPDKELRSDSIPSTDSDIGVGLDETDTKGDEVAECPHSDISDVEVFDKDLSVRELCVSVLKSNGLFVAEGDWPVRSSVPAEVLGICSGSSFKSCKLCGNSDDTRNMLLCDDCDEAFHVSCCNPKIKMPPGDNWFCNHCSKFNCKVSEDNSSQRLPNIWSNGVSKFEMGPIALMLKYPEPYKSRVRIGESFQAEVPDWSDQISNDVDCIGEPLEYFPDPDTLHVYSSQRCSEPNYLSNWLQCRGLLYGDSRGRLDGTICGKWRRAPFDEVQTVDWECSCSVRWDPSRSDCAVPQELETDEVLSHVEYVELLRASLAKKKKAWET